MRTVDQAEAETRAQPQWQMPPADADYAAGHDELAVLAAQNGATWLRAHAAHGASSGIEPECSCDRDYDEPCQVHGMNRPPRS